MEMAFVKGDVKGGKVQKPGELSHCTVCPRSQEGLPLPQEGAEEAPVTLPTPYG